MCLNDVLATEIAFRKYYILESINLAKFASTLQSNYTQQIEAPKANCLINGFY